jgi:glutamate racemase
VGRPVGVFDSGVGGLTVLRELSRTLPGERFLYFGDTARVPYGTKSGETVTRYSIEIANYLITRHDIKMLVATRFPWWGWWIRAFVVPLPSRKGRGSG